MRGTTIKNIKKWSVAAWEASTPEQQKELGDYDTFLTNVLRNCKGNKDAKNFILHSLKEHYNV
jgi:hypothetical protein